MLGIGVALVNLLLSAAPRRGKRPDVGRAASGERGEGTKRRRIRVVNADGALLNGTPERIAARLGYERGAESAEDFLRRLEAAGLILM